MEPEQHNHRLHRPFTEIYVGAICVISFRVNDASAAIGTKFY
jgi:hypothetical protein